MTSKKRETSTFNVPDNSSDSDCSQESHLLNVQDFDTLFARIVAKDKSLKQIDRDEVLRSVRAVYGKSHLYDPSTTVDLVLDRARQNILLHKCNTDLSARILRLMLTLQLEALK